VDSILLAQGRTQWRNVSSVKERVSYDFSKVSLLLVKTSLCPPRSVLFYYLFVHKSVSVISCW
jgi:hypothetical protein